MRGRDVSAEDDLDAVVGAFGAERYHVAPDGGAVDYDLFHSAADVGGVGDGDAIACATEAAADFIAVPGGGDAGIDDESVIAGTYAEDELSDGIPVPSGCACEP